MKMFLTAAIYLAILNVVLFAAYKLIDWLDPIFLKLFAKITKTHLPDILQDPEGKAKDKVRTKYRIAFWNAWFIFVCVLNSLNSVYFYIALAAGVVLHLLGGAEVRAIMRVSNKYRQQEYLEQLAAQDNTIVEEFLTELKKQVETRDKKIE